MPIDINSLRADKGGDPALWREMTVKRCKPASLVDNVIELDEVRGPSPVLFFHPSSRRGAAVSACVA